MSDVDSEASSEGNAWLHVDLSAYELLGIEGDDEIDNTAVREAYELRMKESTDEQQRLRLGEAFRTIETESCRQGYRLALSLYASSKLDDDSVASEFTSTQEPSQTRDRGPTNAGIAGILCAPGAPYARLLTAALKVRNNFELELPQIIVCGTESQGKSSTLERIAMRDIFPRDRRFCTRMPVRLMLRASRHQNQVTIRVKDLNTGDILRSTEPQVCMTGDQTDEAFSAQVAELIREFIRDEHPDDPERNVVVDREVQVEIRAPSVPTIDLVDLPGIVTAPELASEATVEITRRMLTQEHVLVLAVVSGRSESLHDNGIWPLLRAANKPTVVVLTNVDRDGGDEDLQARLELHSSVVPHDVPITAMVPVANRDTRRNNDISSLLTSDASEEEVLRTVCEGQGIEYTRHKHGIPAVLGALNQMLRVYMRDYWVNAELTRCRGILGDLFGSLWELGADPSAIDQGMLNAELEKGLNALAQLPTAEFMTAVRAFDLGASYVLPESLPIFGRVRRAREIGALLERDMDLIVANAWAGFKSLVKREVLENSSLPLKIARFTKVTQHVEASLEGAFETARSAFVVRVTQCAKDQLCSALVTVDDSLDSGAVWSKVETAMTLTLVESFIAETLPNDILPGSALALEEEEDIASKRSAIEEQLRAMYLTAEVLEDLCEAEDEKARATESVPLRYEWLTTKMGKFMAGGKGLDAFLADVVDATLLPVAMARNSLVDEEQEGLSLLVARTLGPGVMEATVLDDPSLLVATANGDHDGPRNGTRARGFDGSVEVPNATILELPQARPEADGSTHEDKTALLAAVQKDGLELQYAEQALRGDKKIVREAVKQNGLALEFACDELRADKKTVRIAVANDGRALKFALGCLRGKKKIVLEAIKNDRWAIMHAAEGLLADKEVVQAAGKEGLLKVVTTHWRTLEHAADTFRRDRGVVLKAVKANGMALQFAAQELHADKEIVLEAVKNDRQALTFASRALQEDADVLQAAEIGKSAEMEGAVDSGVADAKSELLICSK